MKSNTLVRLSCNNRIEKNKCKKEIISLVKKNIRVGPHDMHQYISYTIEWKFVFITLHQDL